MAGRQRPFIGLMSPEIQMRTTGGMENGLSGTDAVCGRTEAPGCFSVRRGSAGMLLSNLTMGVYHKSQRSARPSLLSQSSRVSVDALAPAERLTLNRPSMCRSAQTRGPTSRYHHGCWDLFFQRFPRSTGAA
jgi:hypothetical protein